MRTLIGVLLVAALPNVAHAVFSIATVPEPGALELVGIGAVALVVARLLSKRK